MPRRDKVSLITMHKPWIIALAIHALFSGALCGLWGAEAEPSATLREPADAAQWARSVTLRGGIGYKDNILLNKHNEQESAFWLTSADFFVLREEEHGNHLTFFGSFEDRRYFSAEGIDKEQIATSQLDLKHDIGDKWQVGVAVQYVYLDQALDVSITENVSQSIPVRAHALSGAPYLIRLLPLGMRLEGRFEVERQFVAAPLDDYWEGGPEITLGITYGNRSDIYLSYSYHERAYDERRHFGLDFASIPDTSLRFQRNTLETGLKHYWDKARQWRTTAKISYDRNEDNGSGFYDYNKYKVTLQTGYSHNDWEARIQARVTQYDFDRQPIDFGRAQTLSRTEWNLNAQARWTLYKSLTVFLESDHEWVESNQSLESYQVNTVMGGVEIEF
ncbi:MAG: hypothetical protein ACO1QB_10870 [Verrucomicrobiales bacterium]